MGELSSLDKVGGKVIGPPGHSQQPLQQQQQTPQAPVHNRLYSDAHKRVANQREREDAVLRQEEADGPRQKVITEDEWRQKHQQNMEDMHKRAEKYDRRMEDTRKKEK